MKRAGVSLIVVNLNGLEHLPALFDSIRDLRFPQGSIEIVLVDNGSTDGSVRWVKEKCPHARIIENERNEGFASACNRGASNAEGEWLAFVNNDMRLDPDWLDRMFQAIEESGEETVCAGSRILSWDGTHIDFIGGLLTFYGHSFQKNFDQPVRDVTVSDRPAKTLFACGGAMLIRKDVFAEAGGFDDDYFAYFEDVDLGWRLWILGYEVVFAPSAVAYHKRFGTLGRYGGSRHLFLCERNALFTIYKNYSDENLRRVLPAAMILLIHRVLLHTTAASLDFSVKPDVESDKPDSLDNSPQGSRLVRALSMLGEAGIDETIKRARLSSALGRMRKSGMYPISEEGLSILSALPHLVSNLDALNRRRQFVQANRKRPDGEIFALFGEPFRPLPDEPDFRRLTEIVSENFELDKMFGL
jgi:GT2 family glycosyltransferase